LLGVILVLLRRVANFALVHSSATPGRNKNKQKIVRGYSWHILGVDWPLLATKEANFLIWMIDM